MTEKTSANTGHRGAAKAVLLGFLLLMGCDENNSDTVPRVCGVFDACGGSVVGTWTYDDRSIECGPSSPEDFCPGYSQTGELRTTKSMTFSADGTWRYDVTIDGKYQATFPLDCGSCMSLSTSNGTKVADCREVSAGTCHCDYNFNNAKVTNGEGTYQTSAGSLTTVDWDNSKQVVEYCVEGSTLRMHSIASTGEPMTIAAKKK